MTNNRRSGEKEEPNELKGLSGSVNLFTPVFTTPLDIRAMKACRSESRKPLLPGIVYPFELAQYRFPCDLGSHIFWQSYKSTELELDCGEIGIHNGQDLLELCFAPDAADYIANYVSPKA